MPASFPLVRKSSNQGYIPNPIVPIQLLTQSGYVLFHFLVDTGSDFSLIPAVFAGSFGFDTSKMKSKEIRGLNQASVRMYVAKVTIKITHKPIEIRCGFTEGQSSLAPGTPFILGTIDIFDKYNIHFDNKAKLIHFIDI